MRDETLQRVKLVYDLLGRGGYWTANEITEAIGQPKGTISPFLSFLVQTKNVVYHNHKYKLPDFPKRADYVANDIKALVNGKRKIRIEKRNKRFESLKITPQPFPKNPEPLNLFKGEEFETIQVKIQNAIELLKSNGYKILAKKTEYTEI